MIQNSYILNIDNLHKLYYSIGEVADIFNVSNSLIRYWEREFPSLKPKKTKRGDRKFTKKDILELSKIYDLVKVKGYTLDGAKKALRQKSTKSISTTPYQANLFTRQEVIEKLKKIKSKLTDIRSNMEEE